MNNWIADVQQAAFRLKEVGYIADDEDKILVLTQGLPSSCDSFIISLDTALSIPVPDPDNPTIMIESTLSLEVVKARLINEEARQFTAPGTTPRSTDSQPDVAMHAEASHSKPRTPLANITCFSCGKKGHYQINCPDKKVDEKGTTAAAAAATKEPDGVW
ncbi:hypothetical protein BJ138DRAFT_1020721 [Hygrophoropsis aurantiaca]|uniref:Uncharacterized protein n=1 Tax=Hygrophoropsis aurantiaca TaxID=72124 RepID=A0ACB7ZRB3_9AGAM|nr:hypothetical protein BJ138DRAFT_1020721 [Hygrophoropsis aurantiaca]